ncbi:MAG: hypothetical protein P4L40_24485 [Terracidiphilus sp.]|nr:hypothetical protein [Terracidiphilus sp.]
MSAPSPAERAVQAINQCAELTHAEKKCTRLKCIDPAVVAIINGTDADDLEDTIRQLLAGSPAGPAGASK